MYRLKYTGALSALVFLFLLILIIYSKTPFMPPGIWMIIKILLRIRTFIKLKT
jgi:hypothetical protein